MLSMALMTDDVDGCNEGSDDRQVQESVHVLALDLSKMHRSRSQVSFRTRIRKKISSPSSYHYNICAAVVVC